VYHRSEIVVPASIGNVGPGFDAASVALQLYLRVRVLDVDTRRADGDGTIAATFTTGEPVGGDGVERAFRVARQRIGRPTPALRIEISTDIPICAGLGSSAAATVAGLRLYEAVTEPLSEADLLELAAELEGHPDNAAACLLGGFVVSCRLESGRVIARSSPWPARVRWAIATPEVQLPTKEARAVLPAVVPLEDAVFNLQRALLLLHAVQHDRLEGIRELFGDRLHQPARTALVPALQEALALEHPAVLGVVLCGAGPSIAAVAAPGREQDAAAALSEIYQRFGIPVDIRTVSVHQPAAAGAVPISIA
jgi:homoserine kinase